jgi:hypothetical protein
MSAVAGWLAGWLVEEWSLNYVCTYSYIYRLGAATEVAPGRNRLYVFTATKF